MAKVEGLNLRGSRFFVRILIPGDLQQVYNKTRVNVALGTSERKEATLLATLKRAEWLAEFESKRSELAPARIDLVTPELASLLAARVRAYVLGEDDRIRSDLALLAEMVHFRKELERKKANPLRILNLDLPQPREDYLSGATAEERHELAGSNADDDGIAAIALAGRNLLKVLPYVQAEAAKLGVFFDVKTPGAKDALLASLKAYRTAHNEVALRDAGQVVDTPMVLTTPNTLKPAKPRTLRDVFDRWKTSGDAPRSEDAIGAYDRALRQFEGQHVGVALSDINREMGDKYRSWLREACKTPKTARDRLNAIKSLLKFATETLEWIPKHSWRGLDIKASTTNARRPWADDELTTLFATPLHTTYALPSIAAGGLHAAYWIPLLGLYTGARLGELCQLRTVDVQSVEAIHVLVLTDDGEGQKIKTDAGRRSVPIHSELIRLGFLRYVQSIKASGSDSLWPTLTLRQGKPSDFFGRWFRKHREPLGLTPTFHYFRHTVRPLMRRAGFSESTQDKITGHETNGSVGSTVYDHWTLKELQEAVESIQYPALNLSVVSPHTR